MPLSEEDMVAQLRRLGYRVSSPPAPRPPARCHVCGAVDEDTAYTPQHYDMTGIPDDTETAEYLTQLVVQTNLGEEGHDKVVLFFCEEHDVQMIEMLRDIGIVSHHHGGTAFLADRACPGERDLDSCPYGRHSPYDLSDDGMYI